MIQPYDIYGHCVVCHKNMLIEQVIDQRVQRRFTPDYSETEFLLDDGSRMRVAICKLCKVEELNHDKIMECVIEGWKREVKEIIAWSDEKKEEHIEVYSQKKILVKSENVPDDMIEKKFKEHQEKVGKLK